MNTPDLATFRWKTIAECVRCGVHLESQGGGLNPVERAWHEEGKCRPFVTTPTTP